MQFLTVYAEPFQYRLGDRIPFIDKIDGGSITGKIEGVVVEIVNRLDPIPYQEVTMKLVRAEPEPVDGRNVAADALLRLSQLFSDLATGARLVQAKLSLYEAFLADLEASDRQLQEEWSGFDWDAALTDLRNEQGNNH